MFDPSAAVVRNEKARTTRQLVEWTKQSMPGVIREAVAADPSHVMINVREVACGDPNCAPIDTVVMLIFKNGRQAMGSFPMTMSEVRQGDVQRTVGDLEPELLAYHEDRDFVPPNEPMMAPLSSAGEAALDRILAVLRRELMSLSTSDVVGVCASAMDLLEQIEDQALRPPAASMLKQGTGAPPDPNTKILSAAQKDDVDAVRLYVEQEGISPSFANALGQTPLHIAAMWGNAETLAYLVQAGANVHAINQLSNASPLHVAAGSNKDVAGRLRCATILLEHGADPTVRDHDGEAPWQKCRATDPASRQLMTLLKEHFDARLAAGAA